MRPPLFISHGAPDVLLRDTPAHRALTGLMPSAPDAVVIVSAHWESHRIEITSGERLETIHDFRGFDPVLNQAIYAASGAPALAHQLAEHLTQTGIETVLNPRRGRDHGAWIPMALLRPKADVPVIQISLPITSDDAVIALGEALSHFVTTLDVQIIGSGSLTHSLMDSLREAETAPSPAFAIEFRDAILPYLETGDLEAVKAWRGLPHAQRNHPTPEHIRPLLLAMAVAPGRPGTCLHTSWSRGALSMDIWQFG